MDGRQVRTMTHRELVDAAMRGDHDAFEALATAASGRLYAIARLILRDAHLAEDALQETLIHIWRSLPTLRDPERFDAWSYRLLVNACADAGRERRRLSAEVRLIRQEPSGADAQAAAADRDQIDRAFRRLKPEQRMVLVLHYYAGLPARDVAEVMGIPVGTAKSRIHYAIEIVRGALEADSRGSNSMDGRTA
jgi:RNA polymerase sigma-70 factor (ECF subfamily)